MPNFQTRVEKIQAVQWNGEKFCSTPSWLVDALKTKDVRPTGSYFSYKTKHGFMPILDGDWLILRDDGTLSSLGVNGFKAKYEQVIDDNTKELAA